MDEEQRRPTSRLEQLPAELRDRIYCYLLGDAARIDTWRPLRDPALARTCRLLRAEVLRAAYRRALVTVRASSASTLPDPVRVVGATAGSRRGADNVRCRGAWPTG